MLIRSLDLKLVQHLMLVEVLVSIHVFGQQVTHQVMDLQQDILDIICIIITQEFM